MVLINRQSAVWLSEKILQNLGRAAELPLWLRFGKDVWNYIQRRFVVRVRHQE